MSTEYNNRNKENNEIYTVLYAGFPGVGKSHLFKNTNLKVLDSDSSTFDKEFFPQNYIEHVKQNIGKVDIILISSHEVVREALVKESIRFNLVYPYANLKNEYLERYKERGSPDGFMKLINKNWNDWILQLRKQNNCKHLVLGSGQYLSDVVYLSYKIGSKAKIKGMNNEVFLVKGLTEDKILLEGDFSQAHNIIQSDWIKINDVSKS